MFILKHETLLLMPRPKSNFRIIDSVIYLLENFTADQIKELRQMNIINNRIVTTMEVKKCFDNQKAEDLRTRYEHTADDMNISERYVRKLLNE